MKDFKRTLLSITVCLLISVSCYAQVEKSKRLSSLYLQYNKTKSAQVERQFFKEFPDFFNDFQAIYGYDDVKGASPNYKVAFEHVDLFFKAAVEVDSTQFIDKVVGICLNGKWNADAENYFQEHLRQYLFTHLKNVVKALSNKERSQVDSFWYFFFDGTLFNERIYQKTRKILVDYPSMEKSLDKMARVVKMKVKE